MTEGEPIYATWIIEEKDRELFEQTADNFGMKPEVIGGHGDTVEAGSADTEVAQGNIALRVPKPADPDKYFDFVDAWRSTVDQD